MLLSLSTWQEVEAYLEHSTGVIVPVGSTEQHGPNGLIGTDAFALKKSPMALPNRKAFWLRRR